MCLTTETLKRVNLLYKIEKEYEGQDKDTDFFLMIDYIYSKLRDSSNKLLYARMYEIDSVEVHRELIDSVNCAISRIEKNYLL